MKHVRVVSFLVAVAALGFAGRAAADPITPFYSRTYTDCTTFQNQQTNTDGKQRWTITELQNGQRCDSYQNEYYERPTTQTYQVNETAGGEIFAATEYYQNLDIVLAQAGFDETYFYVMIDLAGLNHVTEDGKATFEGLIYQYEFLLSTSDDGSGGYWFSQKEGSSWPTTSFTYGLGENEGQKDTNGDVGGTGVSITKQDVPSEVNGNGFDTDWIDDGRLKSTGDPVLYSRINPLDPTIIEFALDYSALGFTQAQLQAIIDGQSGYLDFRAIKGGPKDPQNYLWNDEYTKAEAGSPYRYVSGPCPDGSSPTSTKSEYCTQGLGNIYTLDTLRATSSATVPEPASILLFSTGLAFLSRRYSRRR